jgi:hypothetical protein
VSNGKHLLGRTVGVSFAYHVGGVVARDLDGRYADSPLARLV